MREHGLSKRSGMSLDELASAYGRLMELSESEWQQMLELIRRYGMEVDQWDMFQLPSEHGPVYVSIGLAPSHGATDGDYRVLDPESGRELLE
jgi:hypothetical protein